MFLFSSYWYVRMRTSVGGWHGFLQFFYKWLKCFFTGLHFVIKDLVMGLLHERIFDV